MLQRRNFLTAFIINAIIAISVRAQRGPVSAARDFYLSIYHYLFVFFFCQTVITINVFSVRIKNTL
jgi:hypothetical protein